MKTIIVTVGKRNGTEYQMLYKKKYNTDYSFFAACKRVAIELLKAAGSRPTAYIPDDYVNNGEGAEIVLGFAPTITEHFSIYAEEICKEEDELLPLEKFIYPDYDEFLSLLGRRRTTSQHN